MKTLSNKRILVCGKGGSGKSTVVALMATILKKENRRFLQGNGNKNEGEIRRAAKQSYRIAVI